MTTREKYDCNDCNTRIEKKWAKNRTVPVRIFEDCTKCKKLTTYTLINSLYGVSQPEAKIEAFVWTMLEGICEECCEEPATHWGLCGSCYWKKELDKEAIQEEFFIEEKE